MLSHSKAFVIVLLLASASNSANAADPLGTWHVRYEEPGALFRRVIYGNDVFLAFGPFQLSSINLRSSNGTVWERYLPSGPIEPVAFIDGFFFSDEKVSVDGIVWTNLSQRFPARVASGNGFYVGVRDGSIFVSSNLFNWAVAASNPWIDFRGVAFGNGRFVAAGNEGGRSAFLSSVDGLRWIYRRSAEGEFVTTLHFGNGVFLATGDYSGNPATNLLSSSDALTWTAHEGPFYSPIVVFAESRFICAGYNPTNDIDPIWVYDSFDGVSWNGRPLGQPYYPTAISYGHQTVVLTADDVILQSESLTNGPSAMPAHLAVQMHAGITITGLVGRVYQIQQTATVEQTNSWQTVTNILVTKNPFLWLDPTPPAETGRRIYRALLAD